MKEQQIGIFEVVGKVGLGTVALVCGILWRSYVLSKAWAWLVIPWLANIFHWQVAQLSLGYAFVLSTILAIISPTNTAKEKEKFAATLSKVFLINLFYLLLAWIAKRWV